MEQAIYITVVGMGLLFVALIIVMAATVAVDRLFSGRTVEQAKEAEKAAAPPVGPAMVQQDAHIAAVIGLALQLAGEEEGGEAPPRLPSSVVTLGGMSQGWRAAGRVAAMR